MAAIVLIIVALSCILTVSIFSVFIGTGKIILGNIFIYLEIISLIIGPLTYLLIFDAGMKNECCFDSAVFSPEHRLSIYVLSIICIIAYFFAAYRKKVNSPVVEIIVNALLLTGITLNVFIGIQDKEPVIAILGNLPIVLLFILLLIRNQRKLAMQIQQMDITPKNNLGKTALQILQLKPLIKFPLLFVLCLPVLAIITAVLLLVGQKPDSMIRAFTDTYHHGFSQLDYMCKNVECGDHFLCSVAAKGHKHLVKPTRLGIRHEQLILCNRQLLISNAFEDLLQQKLPFLHKPIRRSYNRVGHVIHRYYTVFNKKWVCDIIYVLMKPAEWIFLFTLYTFDKNPENRIAKQYISRLHRQQIEGKA